MVGLEGAAVGAQRACTAAADWSPLSYSRVAPSICAWPFSEFSYPGRGITPFAPKPASCWERMSLWSVIARKSSPRVEAFRNCSETLQPSV